MNEVYVICSESGDEYKLQFTTERSGVFLTERQRDVFFDKETKRRFFDRETKRTDN